MVGTLSHVLDKWSSSRCPSISGVKAGTSLPEQKGWKQCCFLLYFIGILTGGADMNSKYILDWGTGSSFTSSFPIGSICSLYLILSPTVTGVHHPFSARELFGSPRTLTFCRPDLLYFPGPPWPEFQGPSPSCPSVLEAH